MPIWLDTALKIIHIVKALIDLWRLSGTEAVKEKHKQVCDEVCELRKLKDSSGKPI